MQFPLTPELTSRIIFAMEDQRHRFLIDRWSGELAREEELAGIPSQGGPQGLQPEEEEAAALDGRDPGRREWEERYVPLPRWGPTEGFHLMERFVLKLRNPIFAGLLREALSSGKGVFRKFKDILKRNQEVERLWLLFKDREMRRVVEEWYEDQCELAGLERLASEKAPERDLALSDFSILPGEARHIEAALRLDKKGWLEQNPEAEAERAEALYRASRQALPSLLDRRSLFVAAETPAAGLAGFAWAAEEEDPLTGRLNLRLVQLTVRKHLRGLGLASLLMKRLMALAHERGSDRVVAPLQGSTLALQPLFEGLGFRPRALELEVEPLAWEEEG